MKHRTALVLFAFAVILISIPLPVRAAPSLSTDQPLYTTRDKEVMLVGTGLSPTQTYYVWVKRPGDNATKYSGISFLPVSGGLLPPDINYALAPNATLGTYLLSLSTSSSADNAQTIAHFGVWGSANPVYQRTQSVVFLGGGIFPGTGLSLTVRDSAGNIVHQATLASTTEGEFNHTWRIPANAITNVFTAFVDGTGVFDNPQEDFVSQAKFTVTDAILSLNITQQPNSTYQRTQNAAATVVIQYPDGSPVTSLSSGTQPAALLLDQTTVASANLTVSNAANGVWTAATRILPNATPGSKYRFAIPAMAFDDGYGNKGAAVDTYSNYFSVTNATLTISSQLNGTDIQIPFGQVSILSKVTYPDGTPLTAGIVTVTVYAGGSATQLQSTFDPSTGQWRASYSSTLSDLSRVGTWTLRATASDAFGNSGTATYDVTAQPYLFIAVLIAVVAVLLSVRWSVSRYGRRIYFRVWKILRRPRFKRYAYG